MLITINFTNVLNVSVQPGDILYVNELVDNQIGVNFPANTNNPQPVGIITVVDFPNNKITVDTTGFVWVAMGLTSYYFFGKDKVANASGILGYYASVEYRNYSKKKAEIFATGTEYAPSSK